MSSPGSGESAAERSARHIAMLQRLAELSMQLAVRAAEDAIRCPPAPRTRRNARTDPHVMFARLSRCVRETLALKARIAAGQSAAGEQTDARHATVLEWLQSEIAAAHHRDPHDGGAGELAVYGSNRH